MPMEDAESYSGYDQLAWFYNRHWGADYHWQTLRILDTIVLNQLPSEGRVLDLCCGTGHITRVLAERGYEVTGVDGSAEMLRYARENSPGARFFHYDARSFSLPAMFDAVISTFESLNHILDIEGLAAVFSNVMDALTPGGIFVFDLLTDKAYMTHWGKSHAIVEADNVCILRGGYDAADRIARSEITMFRLREYWERYDVTLFQRCHDDAAVLRGLKDAGFHSVGCFDAASDLGMTGDVATGRVFFKALKLGCMEWTHDGPGGCR